MYFIEKICWQNAQKLFVGKIDQVKKYVHCGAHF